VNPATPAAQLYGEGYKRLVLALLVSAYTLNFIDRTIISTIGVAIKVDLKISDTQLGLLGGLYFTLLYTLLGIPLARLAERFSRVNIIAGAILIWSGFTALCGTATSFVTLSLFRVGVGFGEAGLSPPAHALISDYFEPRRRASALSVYGVGIQLGALLGAVIGGWLAQNYSWRIAFMVVGLPGVAVAVAIKALVKDPPRGLSEPAPDLAALHPSARGARPAAPGRGSLWRELCEIGQVLKTLFGVWPVANMVLGVTILSIAGYGGGLFAPAYFLRAFPLNYAQVGLIVGLVAGVSSVLGTLAGGYLTDRLARRSPRWYALTPAIGIAASFPFTVLTFTAGNWPLAAAFLCLPGLLSSTYLGPTFGVVQNMAGPGRRATAAAILLAFISLIGLGGGPPLAGWLIDSFAAFHFAHPRQTGLWPSLLGLFSGASHGFEQACPGGRAPAHAAAPAALACKTALVLGTRQGLLVIYAFGLWAAAHYLLGAIGLTKALARGPFPQSQTPVAPAARP
jgi:MFS family permease